MRGCAQTSHVALQKSVTRLVGGLACEGEARAHMGLVKISGRLQ
jgi:hypothetical protein